MKTVFLNEKLNYDGSQLRSLFAYLNHKLLGDSCVCFIGSCNISFENMLDGEDFLERSEIKGSEMLHFIFEIFDRELVTGVFLQRLFASIISDEIYKQTKTKLIRTGDDLYLEGKKLSISVATKSPNSVLVHFAMNISNLGTPVPTLSLEDLDIQPKKFAEILLKQISEEYDSILVARLKVKATTSM